jgi:cytochrome c
MKAVLSATCLFSFATLPAFAEGDAARGEKVFKKCAECHTADEPFNKTGPYLVGIVGRKVASIYYKEYSPEMVALGEAGAVWDEASLDRYLTNPKDMVPNGYMSFPGIKEPDERADLIAYLKTK